MFYRSFTIDYNIILDKIKLGNKKIKVVYDCGNGTTSIIADQIFANLNVESIPLFNTSDGTFPNHHPDPCVYSNLTKLKEKVLEVNADLGIGYDGDGDRVGFIDNLGNMIETDKFMSGALENRAHNIYLETSQKTKEFDSQVLKNITGSMYQTIECKGIQKYSSIINCKHVFAANDQAKLKFSDTTHGFRRRINVYEIWYRWDSQKRYLKRGDYYETSFSDSLKEIKSDILEILKNAEKYYKKLY